MTGWMGTVRRLRCLSRTISRKAKSPKEVLSGENVGINVRTSADVTRVELCDENGQVVAEATSPGPDTGTEKTWSLT